MNRYSKWLELLIHLVILLGAAGGFIALVGTLVMLAGRH